MLSTDLIYEVGRKQSMIYSWKIFSQVCVLFLWVASVQVLRCACVCVFLCLRVTCVQFTKQEPLCSHIADADVNLTIAISLTVIGTDFPNCQNSPDTYFPVSVRRPRFSTMTAMRCNVGVIRARFNAAISESPQPGLPGQCGQNCLEIVLIVRKYWSNCPKILIAGTSS